MNININLLYLDTKYLDINKIYNINFIFIIKKNLSFIVVFLKLY